MADRCRPYDAPVTPVKVAVIGAGPSGIATTKELLEEGHDPTCFERAGDLGGVFRFGEDDGVVWESCRLTSSGLLTAFSDFPAPDDQLGHMTTGEYVTYLERYASTFGISSRIRFDTEVSAVLPDPAGRWIVRTATRDGRDEDEQRFDAVAVCSGLHQHPLKPTIPWLERFQGEVLHGAEYRRPAQVKGRRVLVIGAGESGADVVAEVAEHAAETVVSLRRGVAVLPRKIRGRPNDYRTCRIANSSADWVFETRNPADRRKLDVYRIVFLPVVVADKLVQMAARLADGVRASRRPPIERATTQLTKQLLAESGGTLQEQFGTKSDEWVAAIASGRCRRVGAVVRFDEGGASFEGGERFEPDLVVLCTGFETKVPFIDDALTEAPRYLHTFAPSVGPSLAFVGFVRPAFGAIPPLAELQARWFALVLSGAVRLPPEAAMTEGIEQIAEFRRRYFRAVRERLDHLVDFTSFCDALAAEIGCKPTKEALARESTRFRRRFFDGPFVAAQYRLVGPHAKPEIARAVIEALPVAYPRHELLTFHVRASLSRVLHRLLGSQYAPKLELR